jgi:2-keto-3-deoxy-L-fuconate dehydrogenase
MTDFDGLVAIVTGGASGIGAATVQRLRARGAQVGVLDLRDAGPGADLSIACDITDALGVESSVRRVVDSLGQLDVVVNNAGIGAIGTVEDADDDLWHRVLDVNVIGAARVSRSSLPYLRQSRHAAIVNVASYAALVGIPDRCLYSTSKGALASMTRAMAIDHLRDRVRVNAVLPGTVNTPWIQRLLETADDPAEMLASLEARQPMNRLVTADEVANAVAYLASPTNGSTTGVLLPVDGGILGTRPM